MPSLFKLPSGVPALALAVDRNLALQDPLTDAQRDDLLGPGSALQKFVRLFAMIGVAHAPDGAAIAKAARAHGYDGNIEDITSYRLDGGYRPTPRANDITSSLYLNWESTHTFEFALSFRLDPRLEAADIVAALCAALELPAPSPKGRAKISLGDGIYTISLLVEDALSGSYAFVLRK